MPNRNYERGRRFEYKVKHQLEQCGFIVVRTAGSHSPFDLIALKDSLVYFMQLKYGAPITKAEQQKMYSIMHEHGWNNRMKFLVVHGKPYKKTNWYQITGDNQLKEY